MTLIQLQYFCAVCRYHSITRAANELFVSQPTISVSIRDLENEFHLRLFNHEKNKITLTPDGEAFYIKAQQLVDQSYSLQAEFSTMNSSKKPIKVGIPPLMSTVFFPKYLYEIKKRTDISISLYEYGSNRACSLVDSEDLDMAIVNLDFYGLDRFNYHVLLEDNYVLCLSNKHRFSKKNEISIADLEMEPLIFYNTDSVQNQTIGDRFRSQNVTPNIFMHSSQLTTILNTLKGADCSAFLYSSIPVPDDEYVKVAISPAITNKFGIIWKKGIFISERASTLINLLMDIS